MNRKGFTLVELLAVIIILSLLALITSTSITKLVSDSKDDLSDVQIQLIKSAAQTWGADNLSQLPNVGECSYITLGDLKKYGIIDSKIINPKNNQEISDDLKIKISNDKNEYGKEKISYEVNASEASIKECERFFPCTYTKDSQNHEMVTCGSESFYILEETSSTVTALAKHNITLTNRPAQDPTDEENIETDAIKNPLAFTSTVYWLDSGTLKSEYSIKQNQTYPYVYDLNSNLYKYVEKYKTVLEEKGVNIIDIKLLSYEQAIEQGCIPDQDSTHESGNCNAAPSWIYSTNYWLGSATANSGAVWAIAYTAEKIDFSTPFGNFYNFWGIRPVITIPVSDVKVEE